MQALIEELSGFLPLIVILGFIVSFLKKANQHEKSEGDRAETGAKPIGKIEDTVDNAQEISDIDTGRYERDAKKYSGEFQLPNHLQTLSQDGKSFVGEVERPVKQKRVQTNAASQKLRDDLSAKHASKGVIWAEILGPPKAMRRNSVYPRNKRTS
ncbi:hypothetical protein G4V62_00505 [Bacillaceae bacterium SIJ1]|uniref:hypothetical protein n=1 Tax=Litoribacterium kuwaitense TaxID=1398745 RepID=UPI0013EB01CB|nr:hypothetical protein [Litoribacterium kuwaitense]NGP43518.1 hypothetical protein [Litoribacterium kuwaitense]